MSLSQYSYHVFRGVTGGVGNSCTGFFIRYEGKVYLVTSWHIFSGLNPFNFSKKDLLQNVPDRIRVARQQISGKIEIHNFPVFDNRNNKKYIEFAKGEKLFDVAIYPIDNPKSIKFILNHDVTRTAPLSNNQPLEYFGYAANEDHTMHKTPTRFSGKLISADKNVLYSDVFMGDGCGGSPVFCKQGEEQILIGVIGGTNYQFIWKRTIVIPIAKALNLTLR